MKQIFRSLVLACLLLSQPLSALALEVQPGFNPNQIVPDAVFGDSKTFGGPEGIQRFLESKNSVLANTAPDFLARLSEPNSETVKEALGDPEPNLGRLRTAAELIWDAAQASGLNPQVILVTLQKEQGLITTQVDPARLQRALNHAMGFDCPDSSGCGNLFPGFYYQLFGNVDTEGNRYLGATKSLMKSFSTPNGRGPSVGGKPSLVGDVLTIENTLGDYAGILRQQVVTLGNRATAALYRYTPHVFNGNYNFWKFFTSWFKYPNGTLLTSTQDGAVYIIQNGTRQRVPVFVALSRGLNVAAAITASPTELEGYPIGPTYSPADNTVVTLNGAFFVFLDGVMHPATSFVLTQRQLNVARLMSLTSDEAALFTQGTQLTPTDGVVLKGMKDQAVYLVQNGTLKLFSAFTFKQYAVANKLEAIPDEEIALYPKTGYVPPKEGTLIQPASNNDIYVMSEGRRLPVPAKLFKNLGFNLKAVVRLTSDAEIASIPIGPPATPREGTYFAISESPELYLFKDGAKHLILSFIAKQKGIKPDYAFDASIVSNWPDGIALAPKEGTLLKSEADPAVYLVMKGQLDPITDAVFKSYHFRSKDVIVLSAPEIDLLPKGSFATPPENTYFSALGTKEVYVFQKGVKRQITPFVMTQRGMTPDYTFSKEAVDSWATGLAVAPRDGTLLQVAGKTTVYLVSQGKLHALSSAAFKRRGYRTKQVKTISKAEFDLFVLGDALAK